MNDTIVDMPKVTQMLDAGWRVVLSKNEMGSYSTQATHANAGMVERVRDKLIADMRENKNFLEKTGLTAREAVDEMDFDGAYVVTDDFTPEQALTRLAYKVHGEII